MGSTGSEERQGGDVTINLLVDRMQLALIDRAAQALGKTQSDFILEAACREAGPVVADRRFVLLDEKASRRFTAVLDKAPGENLRLRRVLASRAPWER